MGFIRSNKMLIIGILIGMFVIGAVFFISTQTGLFDEDEQLFSEIDDNVDESGEVIVDESEDNESATGITDAPEEIEGFVDLPSEVDGNDINEDGSFNSVEDEITDVWGNSNIMPVDGDDSMIRDLKEELRVTTYEDYMELQEMGMNSVTQNTRLDLGQLGFPSTLGYIYKNNDIISLGDVNIVGAYVDPIMNQIIIHTENDSGEIMDMNELEGDMRVRFSEDVGVGTDWIEPGEMSASYHSIEDFNGGDVTLTQYLGQGLSKPVSFAVVSMDEIASKGTLQQNLDVNDVLTDDIVMESLGSVANESRLGDNYDVAVEYQNNLPDTLNIEIEYNGDTTDYSILKSTDEMMYNYEEVIEG